MDTQQQDELKHYGVLGMKWGKRKLSRMEDRANRARTEANSATKIAKSYINSMNKKADKRANQAKIKPTSTNIDRAERARTEAKKASKLAKSYIDSMNKKADKRAAQAKEYKNKYNAKQKEYNQKVKEKNEKLVKDNDQRVKLYGKKMVKTGDAIGIASTAYGMYVGNKIIKNIGVSAMKSIAENPNMGNASFRVAEALTVAGMGALTIGSLKQMNNYRKDMKLADEYEYRQYKKKQNKK